MTEPAPLTQRLAKRLAEQLGCSRRDAERYIAGGWVLVDGVVIEEPQFRVAEQDIVLHEKATLADIEPVTILFNKPPELELTPDLIRLETQVDNDRSGIRPLQNHFRALNPTSPLDTLSSGLLVLTQDWRIARKLVEDADRVEQEFVVEVSGELSEQQLKLLNHGMRFNGKQLPPIKVSWQSEARLRFALKGVQPGQIRWMCEQVGLQVLGVRRLRIGRIALAGIPVGQWRYMLGYERF